MERIAGPLFKVKIRKLNMKSKEVHTHHKEMVVGEDGNGDSYFLYSAWCSRSYHYVCCNIPFARHQDKGLLMFLGKKLFMFFIISDTLLFFSYQYQY